MAGGWSKDGAVQDQIDASVDEAVSRVRQQLSKGESAAECDECGEAIPEARRRALQGVRLCIVCQEAADTHSQNNSPLNRRGSKDSQLR